ncbi:hypothetical protein ABZW18_21890 [Streptomyces sp. NPDC004647]|uniref:hypothetical protein n=1 Tax=Streptomyces sp. NPDC004647 TaxID=3154671 RepID=UPI0033BEC491
MADRSLEALGYSEVPAEHPLSYPGRPVTEPAVLLPAARELLPLLVRRRRLGAWYVDGPEPAQRLDAALDAMGQAGTEQRHPVLAVGCNASPAQIAHKLARLGPSAAVPMVPVRVRGIAVGCSGHISRGGYVACTPYPDPDTESAFVVSWLDPGQLAAVDATEIPRYRRAMLPGERFAMTMPSGERLGGAYLYISTYGVLAGPDGRPRPGGGDQSALLGALLDASPRLRELLGPDARTWVRRAGADRELRDQGRRAFREEGWVLPQPGFLPYGLDAAEPYRYGNLPPLGDSPSSLA